MSGRKSSKKRLPQLRREFANEYHGGYLPEKDESVSPLEALVPIILGGLIGAAGGPKGFLIGVGIGAYLGVGAVGEEKTLEKEDHQEFEEGFRRYLKNPHKNPYEMPPRQFSSD